MAAKVDVLALNDVTGSVYDVVAALIRCDCCDYCGESPEYEVNVCANVLAERIALLAAGEPCSMADARAALSQQEPTNG